MIRSCNYFCFSFCSIRFQSLVLKVMILIGKLSNTGLKHVSYNELFSQLQQSCENKSQAGRLE